ncbi:MAG: signal peptidase II [Acidobacteriota bacterium]|nr:signal peptidase II [Acidobacteriota bacterium]
MTGARRITFVLSVIVACVTIDQLTKVAAKAGLAGRAPITFLGDFFRLHYAENPGAILSLGAFLPQQARFWVFVVFVGAVLAVMLVLCLGRWPLSTQEVLGFSLIIGGGSSNLADRIRHDGLVTDFMNIGVGGLRTGIFNVADVAILAGAGLLIWWEFVVKPRRKRAEK